MKTNYLFPYSFKKGSGIILVFSLLALLIISIANRDYDVIQLSVKTFALIYDKAGIHTAYFGLTENNIIDEIIMTVFIICGLIFAFSKEKIEDEMVSKIRLESLVWATYVNYVILLICVIFIYGLSFLQVMEYNMFTLLLFFIIRFHWTLYKNSKLNNYDE
ncbi:Ca2+/Na+ antiporter [Flavobacterium sp. PL11]|jgi:Ca2+/Na+ antiporter|uniref:hypothetical protein n=1 Tax=Flavobacterium sp. PL11 TaxID=3071717 RepID=UPI002E085761|nr:Ca2+/Na+ antiporter [Flavobacterium sp. PL11]